MKSKPKAESAAVEKRESKAQKQPPAAMHKDPCCRQGSVEGVPHYVHKPNVCKC